MLREFEPDGKTLDADDEAGEFVDDVVREAPFVGG